MSDIPDIAQCRVTASYQNNKATVEGEILTIKPTTVSLSFMRYIPAKDNRKSFFVWPQRETQTRYTVEDVPPIDGWSYRPTILREGYLYVYYENNPDLFKEFKVGIGGDLTNIISDLSEDVRLPKEERSRKYLCISVDDIVWVAYSEYQLSAGYIEKLRSNQSLREKRMQKFDGPSWVNNRKAPDCYTVDDVEAYFSLADYDIPPEKKKSHDSVFWTPGTIKNWEDVSAIQQWKSYYDNVEAIEENPDERDEVFFCLHDPLGCADELAGDLSYGVLQLQALVQSIQTGGDQNAIFEALVSGETVNISPNEEYLSLFRLAQTVYLLIYNDEKNIEEFHGGEAGWDFFGSYGVDLQKVKGILGVKERAELRSDLNTRRDLLGNFVKNNYLQDSLDYYSEHNPEGNLAGIVKMFEFLQVLFNNPSDFERTLLLKKDKPPKLDYWQKYILGQIGADSETEPKDKLHRLLSQTIDVDKVYTNTVNLSNKLAGYGVAQLTFLSKKAFATREFNGKVYTNTDDMLQIVVSKMNRVTAFGENMYHFKDGQIELRLQELGAEMKQSIIRFGRYEGTATGVIRIIEGSEGFNIVSSKKGQHILELAVERPGKELSKSEVALNKINHKAAKLLNGTSFTGTVAFLQLLNMRLAVEAVVESPEFKTQINLLGVTSELTEASLHFYVAYRNAMGRKLGEAVARGITRNSIKAGIIGNGVTAILCTWEAIESFNSGDVDAGMALMGAGVAFGTAAGYSAYILATGSSAGPLGWIAALAGFGFMGLAFYLKDSPAEHYFKNFLLRNRYELVKDEEEPPVNYSRRILKEKKMLVKSKYHQLYMLPSDAAASLFDIFVCRQVYFKGAPDITVSRSKRGGVYEARNFNLEIDFFGLLTTTEQFEYNLYWYAEGVDSRKCRFDELSEKDKARHLLSIEEKKSGVRCLRVQFSMPDKWMNRANDDSELLMVFRLNIDKERNIHFPYDLSTQKNRFMGARTKVKYSNPTGLFDGLEALAIGNTRSAVRIDEETELLSSRNW